MVRDDLLNLLNFHLDSPFDFAEYTTKRQNQLSIEEAEFASDCKLFPSTARMSNGKLFWHKHHAAQLLHDDVKYGYGSLRPSELYETRPEYKEFELSFFRRHLYQEIHKQLTGPYWKMKTKKLARKRLEEELDQMKMDWGNRLLYSDIVEKFETIEL